MTDAPKPGRRGFLGLLATAPVAVTFEAKAVAAPIEKMVEADVAAVPVLKWFRQARTFTGMDGSACFTSVMVSGSLADDGETKWWEYPSPGEADDEDREEDE